MKIAFFYSILFFSFSNLIAQTTAIPDTNFEQKLIALGIDTNGANGNILNSDAAGVTTLTLSGSLITNLTGLQAFTNVITLDLGTNQFTTVPLTTLTALQSLQFSGNDLVSSLDFSQNTALRILKLQSNLSLAGDPPLTTLNLANNVNLQELELNRFGNLSNLTLPTTATLTKIRITFLADATLNFSVCSGLKDLFIQESNIATVITLPTVFTVLEKLNIANINIPTIDISNYINLKDLDLSVTYVQNLILPNSTTLEKIRILIHDLQGLQNFAVLPNLKELYIRSNRLTPLTVNIAQNLLLTKLDLGSNKMSTINLTQNVALIDLTLDSNLFTTLNIANNVNIKNLNLSRNLFATINVTQNIALENFNISFNLLPTLNVTQNVNMWGLDISNNLFTGTGLNLTGNPVLRYLKASFNQISSLNITQNPGMNSLILDHNLFTGTNIIEQYYNIRAASSGIGASQYFDVSFNQLSGPMPNIVGLISAGNNGIGAITNYYTLSFDNNNFHFGDFEAQHLTMISYLPLQNQWGNDIIRKYSYAPQAKVNLVETPTIVAGNSITLVTTVRGSQNHYKWFKNNVAIAGAPDSPNYVITSVSPCDSGVYHCEIRSDLVPFENASPPGTNGKNLLLIRNNITLTVTPAVVACSTLTLPANGATNVGINTNFSWTDSPNACGYRLTIGTTSGGTQILNNIDVGNVNSYNLPSNLPINSTIYVTVTPYPASAAPAGCLGQSFNTGTLVLAVPSCVTTTNPVNNAINIPVNQNFSWTPVANATGYNVIMGTTPGGSQIAGSVNTTTNVFNPTADLPQGQMVYLTITPFNADGNAIGCTVFQFAVETIPNPPTCPTSYSLTNGQTNVSINIGGISWASVSSQTQYYVTIGTTATGTEYENNFFNNTSEYYSVPNPFTYSTTYYLRVRVRDQSTGTYGPICSTIVFTTQAAPLTIPNCATNILPANNATNVNVTTNITWNAVSGATGYRVSIGTTSGGTDFVNNFNNLNSTTFNPANNFNQNTTYFITITPYNAAGNAVGCNSSQFTTITIATIPNCTTVVFPSNGSLNVAINSNITWTAVSNINGYFISIGTTLGGIEFINNQNVSNITNFTPTFNFAQNTTYFVTITPYNSTGNAVGCVSQSFTTETIVSRPNCTNLISPLNGSVNVAVNANFSWNAVANATGYFISYGTNNAANNIENMVDVGNFLSYNPPADLPDSTTIYVVITPYNSAGNAVGCGLQFFTTETVLVVPSCTVLTSPINTATNVSVNSNLIWNASVTATGYFVSIGTTPGGSQFLNNFDNGNLLSYNPMLDFDQNTLYFVTITPYNSSGNALGCTFSQFTTETIAIADIEKFFIPTFFTPNGDGFNDVWTILDKENTIKQISVFDRYGKLLKFAKNTIFWDGIFNAQQLPANDYWYLIELIDNKTIKGHFSLKR